MSIHHLHHILPTGATKGLHSTSKGLVKKPMQMHQTKQIDWYKYSRAHNNRWFCSLLNIFSLNIQPKRMEVCTPLLDSFFLAYTCSLFIPSPMSQACSWQLCYYHDNDYVFNHPRDIIGAYLIHRR